MVNSNNNDDNNNSSSNDNNTNSNTGVLSTRSGLRAWRQATTRQRDARAVRKRIYIYIYMYI